MEITLVKHQNLLMPASHQDQELLGGIKAGQGVTVTLKKKRHIQFHRKYFALLNLGFDAWEVSEQEYKGVSVEKNFERFRKDIVILAGFYTPVTNIKGETRLEAKSISFSNMKENEFNKLYKKTIDVLLKRVLKNYTADDVDRVVNELLNFN